MPHAGCLSSLEPTAPLSSMVLHLRVNNLKSICSPPHPFGVPLPAYTHCRPAHCLWLAYLGWRPFLAPAVRIWPCSASSVLFALNTSAASVLPARLLCLLRCFPHKCSLTDPALRSHPL